MWGQGALQYLNLLFEQRQQIHREYAGYQGLASKERVYQRAEDNGNHADHAHAQDK